MKKTKTNGFVYKMLTFIVQTTTYYSIMDRASTLSKTISTFDKLTKEAEILFDSQNILPNSSIMIEEFFERTLNPYLEQLKQTVDNLPIDDYTPIIIGKWIKNLQTKLQSNNVTDVKQYAEVLYIRQKYIPVLIEELQSIKLEVLERLYAYEESPIETVKRKHIEASETILTPEGAAITISNLLNFRILRQDMDITTLLASICPLLGVDHKEVGKHISLNASTYRLEADATAEEIEKTSVIFRSILARIENEAMIKRKNESD